MASDSRQHIVEILKRRNQASVTELSQALGLTAVTIRHHLDTLMADAKSRSGQRPLKLSR